MLLDKLGHRYGIAPHTIMMTDDQLSSFDWCVFEKAADIKD